MLGERSTGQCILLKGTLGVEKATKFYNSTLSFPTLTMSLWKDLITKRASSCLCCAEICHTTADTVHVGTAGHGFMTAQVELLLFCGTGVNRSVHLKLDHPRRLLHWMHLATFHFVKYKESSDDSYTRTVKPILRTL